MSGTRNRIEVLHGVNLDMLGKRDALHYGTLTLVELEVRIRHWSRQLGLETTFFHTNSEGEFVERLHQASAGRRRPAAEPRRLDSLQLRDPRRASRSRACRRSRCTSRTSTSERNGGGSPSSPTWWSGGWPARGPDGYRDALEILARELGHRAPGGGMSAWAARADRLAALVEERGLDLLLVSNLVNVRYLTGFTGTNGAVLIGPARRAFLTDFRYVERAQRQITGYDVVRGRDDLLETVAALVRDWDAAKLGFEDTILTVRAHAKLAEHLRDAAELAPASGLVEQLRAVKDDDEVAAIRRAAELADEVYRWLVSDFGLAGHTEREVALAMELRAKELGADGLSFPPIVAAADNGALPHAEPRADVQIPRDTLVVVDFGAFKDSYCSDCTRTFATGELDSEARECYELVRSAQAAALDAVRAGRSACRGRGRAGADRRGRARGAIRSRAGPRRRTRDPRGAAPRALGGGRTGGGQRRDGGAGRLRAGSLRSPHRGPDRRRLGRPRGADHPPEGPDVGRLNSCAPYGVVKCALVRGPHTTHALTALSPPRATHQSVAAA